MPSVTLTEGDDVYTARFRTGTDIFNNVYMLGGNDQLYTGLGNLGNMRVFMGAGDDYVLISTLMYELIAFGEEGNDTLDVSRTILGVAFDGGPGDDRLNLFWPNHNVNVSGGPGNDSFFANGQQIVGTISGGDGADLFVGFIAFDGYTPTLSGGPGSDTFKNSAAGFAGTSISDFGLGDKIVVTDASLASFTFSLSGSTLTYSGGSMTLSGLSGGMMIASAASGGGVQLVLAGETTPNIRPPRMTSTATASATSCGSMTIGLFASGSVRPPTATSSTPATWTSLPPPART